MKNVLFLKNHARRFFSNKVSPRILTKYNDSIISPMKQLQNKLEHRDVVYVTQQAQRWTVREVDAHSDAFAYYLVEQGISHGDKVLFWSDVSHSLEYISASIGTIKAGNTVVSTEYENWEDVSRILKESGANVLVVSSFSQSGDNKTRIERVQESIPEMNSMQYGDIFKSSQFPSLKQIINISHKTIPGTEKFKHCLNYTKSFMTNISLPDINSNNNNIPHHQIYSDNNVHNLTHSNSLNAIEKFNTSLNMSFKNIVNSAPVFYPANFTLGLIGGFASNSYNVFPGNYNFVETLKLIQSQGAELFIGEDALFDMDIGGKVNDVDGIKSVTESVRDVVIFTSQDSLKEREGGMKKFKEMFENANMHLYDEVSLEKL